MDVFLIIALSGIGLTLGVILFTLLKRRPEVEPSSPSPPIDIGGIERRLLADIKRLPEQIVNSITGSVNVEKGKIGELIGYISIKANYDRIIPLGNIVDFVGIKFPTDTDPGYVHFIDIKTGKHARLNPEQRKLKSLLATNLIEFKTIKIDDVETK